MKFLCVFFLLVSTVLTQNDDSDNIDCQKCKCTESDDAQILTINCANKSLHHVGGKWPTKQNYSTMIVSFAGNDIPTLEPLPPTDAAVEIVFSKCNIKNLVTKLFAFTKNVKFVDLSYNQLEAVEISSDKFSGPYNSSVFEPIALEHLNLAYNKIHSLGQNVFEHMPNLKILNLEGNDFTLLDIHTQVALSSVRKLQSLNLANNELTEMIVGAIESHQNLTELNLSKNNLDFVPSSLSHIGKSLEILNIDENPIIEFQSETFLGLTNIIELSANNLSKLKYVNANTFASMPKLKKLNLSNNFLLHAIDREAFGVNQSIEEFYINNNKLEHLDYHLLPWSKLHVFEFKDNPFDCSCDLYNITKDLSSDITRQQNGPLCTDPRTDRLTEIFHLTSDICEFKSKYAARTNLVEYHFSMIKTAVIVLSIIVATAAILAAALGVMRYLRYRRGMNYPFASQVSYNLVPNQRY